MSSIKIILVLLFGLEKCYSRVDTLLSCHTCMDVGKTIHEECDKNMLKHHTCVFDESLVNWDHVQQETDDSVEFKCLLLYYKERYFSKIKSKRGCVAVYKNYSVCDNIGKIIKYRKQVLCKLCDTRNCNNGFEDGDRNSSTKLYSATSTVMSLFISLLTTYINV